jgi:hypothetical protein
VELHIGSSKNIIKNYMKIIDRAVIGSVVAPESGSVALIGIALGGLLLLRHRRP